jgi:hypothetical protein
MYGGEATSWIGFVDNVAGSMYIRGIGGSPCPCASTPCKTALHFSSVVRGKTNMSRTFRNRHAVPHGWEVRDGGSVFHEDFPNNKAFREARTGWQQEWWDATGAWRSSARGSPFTPPRFRRRWSRIEKKPYRKVHYRRYRAQVKNRMRHEDWEHIPRFTRTSGWLTW